MAAQEFHSVAPEDLTASLVSGEAGLMMAEIHEPSPTSGPFHQATPSSRPTAAAIVTALAGIWAIVNGFAVFMIGTYVHIFSIAMLYMGMGAANVVLGLVGLYAGYSVYNLKSSGKSLGIAVNVILIVANIIVLAVGLLGLALCIVSIILLAMYKPS